MLSFSRVSTPYPAQLHLCSALLGPPPILPSRSRLARFLPLCFNLRSLHSPQPTIRLPVAYSMPLQIAIIGAGIAGLSAAIGLRRAGHDAVVGLLYSLTMRN